MFEDDNNQENYSFPWKEYFSIIYRGRWWILLTFITISSLSTYYTLRMTPVFQAETTIEIKDKDNMFSDMSSPFNLKRSDRVIANNSELIKSRTVAKMVMDEVDKSEFAEHISVSKEVRKDLNENSRIQMLRRKLSIKPIKNTDILRLIITSSSPFEVSFLANTYAEQFELYSKLSNLGEVGAVTNFLKDQLDVIKKRLKLSEEALELYQKEGGIVVLEAETQLLIENSAKSEAKLNEIELNYQSANQKILFLKKELDEKSKRIVEDISRNATPEIEKLKIKVGELNAKKLNIELEKSAGYKRILKNLQKQIDNLEAKITEKAKYFANSAQASANPVEDKSDIMRKILEAQAEQIGLKAQAKKVQETINNYNKKIAMLPETATEFARLKRKYEIDEKTYIMMENKYNEYKIALAGQVGNARIVDKAITPKSPIRPDKPLYITIGLGVGLGLGVFISFLLAFFDNSIKTIEDIERFKINFLGAVPTINIKDMKKKMRKKMDDLTDSEKTKINSKLISHFSPKSPISEAYRTIRTNIYFSSVDSPPSVIVVSSSVPKEGKSTTSSNLAVTIAQSGKKVVLIDADLRRPVVHKNFNILREIGVTDFLIKNSSVRDISKMTDIENLSIITCGDIPPNPSELIASAKMDKFIEELKKEYDVIIFDTPPVITVTDAVVLSRKTDGIVLVVSSGTVGKEEVRRSQDLLRSVDANIIGVILNNLDIKKLYGNYYYYYHYYQYYYYYGADKKKKRRGRA
ncbi:MAG: hypothetical protein CR982_02775 [Candidatus Cloacimonadota bacterium]|nr:MAG: hypothetical protein CR982_02775 [Candidatus Cloacimonadota bacterium]PIE79194.1 MAG: hypothetical protein CSA15_03970 [Candidatus Delongbacteria bacterium]